MISPMLLFPGLRGVEDEVFEGQLAFDDEDGDAWEFLNYTFPKKMEPSSYLKTIPSPTLLPLILTLSILLL